jgi:hypothetical protein
MRRNVPKAGASGYALMAVTILVFIILIGLLALFAMASYETKGALYRQNSSEAFYLADGAVERARAKFLEDRSWRDGWTGVAEGRGSYDLTARDTTYLGEPDVVQLLATGTVGNAARRIEVMAKVPPTALGLPLLVMGDAEIGGNLCLEGDAHVNGDAGGNGGHGDPHLACGGDYTEGFEILPPPVYTDPDHFPNATYYFVRATKIGAIYQARIFDRTGATDITTALGDSLVGVVTYDNGSQTFTFDFTGPARIAHYFDDATGIFRRDSSDVASVVNFGTIPMIDPPGDQGVSRLIFDGDASSTIHATVINARFVGASEAERIDWNYWRGATQGFEVKQIRFEPYYGLAFIAFDLNKSGSAQVTIGTPAWPALAYVTRDVNSINSNLTLTGSLICLRDFHSTGGPDIHYDEGFIENLPDYLEEDWTSGVSGTLKILRWREVAAAN